jgi:hypothetical protein
LAFWSRAAGVNSTSGSGSGIIECVAEVAFLLNFAFRAGGGRVSASTVVYVGWKRQRVDSGMNGMTFEPVDSTPL